MVALLAFDCNAAGKVKTRYTGDVAVTSPLSLAALKDQNRVHPNEAERSKHSNANVDPLSAVLLGQRWGCIVQVLHYGTQCSNLQYPGATTRDSRS